MTNEKHGVWGGMSPGERREFKVYLHRQGFRGNIPIGAEFRAEVNIFTGDDGTRSVADGYRAVRPVSQSREALPPEDEATERSA